MNDPPAFEQALSLTSNGMICLFGAGGKTGMMFTLAAGLTGQGKSVLTTTTTKMFYPTPQQAGHVIICDSAKALVKKCRQQISRSRHLFAARLYDPDTQKVSGFSPDQISRLQSAGLFDWIIVEADGSRQKPIKASAGHEPVFPEACTHLMLVAGLDAVGVPLNDDHVHRAALFSKQSGLHENQLLTPGTVARSLIFEMKKADQMVSSSRRIIILNKADSDLDVRHAKQIINGLKSGTSLVDTVMATVLEPAPRIIHISPFREADKE